MSHQLNPHSRVLLSDALRPPAGYRVDLAVGTTYTLNLTTLLLAPLSFALADGTDGQDVRSLDPVRLLEAVRRYAEVTTVFCEAGRIGVPAEYRSLLTFVEDSVREVLVDGGDRIFHPKIWALRFSDGRGGLRHRLIIASRNLTFDRSWDTALVLDEIDEAGNHADPAPHAGIDAAPAAQFLTGLPDLAVRPLPPDRHSGSAGLAVPGSGAPAAGDLPVPDPSGAARTQHHQQRPDAAVARREPGPGRLPHPAGMGHPRAAAPRRGRARRRHR